MLRTVTIALTGFAGACIIPPSLEVIVPATEWVATCRCEICTDVDPVTLECLNVVTQDRDIYECDDPAPSNDENLLEMRFRQVCDRGDSANSECELIERDMEGNPFVSVFSEESCIEDATEPLASPLIVPRRLSAATVESGTITLRSPNGEGTTNVTGTILFSGGECSSGSCPMSIVSLALRGTTFSFAGNTVASPALFNTTVGDGTYHRGAGIFIIPDGTIEIIASGNVGGRRGVRATSDTQGVGILNQSIRKMLFSQSFTAGDVTVDVVIVANVDNLPPTVTLAASQVFECNQPGAAAISLPANIIDSDGLQHTSQWRVDGQLVAVNVDVLATELTLGSHLVEVTVFDENGGEASASTTVLVQDTTAPALSIDSFCLWPPNHDVYVVDVEDIAVFDVCDPSATVEFVSGSSNQPDNGLGDGNTDDDIVVHPGSVCVRSERQGGVRDGRTYDVVVQATDANGNSAIGNLLVSVPHDQGSNRCDDRGGEIAGELDPRCVTSSTSQGQIGNPEPYPDARIGAQSGGCSSSSSPNLALGLPLLALLRRRRRDR